MFRLRFTIIYAIIFLLNTASLPASAFEITLPEGFQIERFVDGLDKPRFMALSPDNYLFVTDMAKGKVFGILDMSTMKVKNKTGTKVFAEGLKIPHGIAFYDGYLYVGETSQIVRYKYNGFHKKLGEKEIIVPEIPTKGHFTRTVSFGPDKKMYISIGSSCNVCIEEDKRRATIMRFNPDGTGGEIFATGLRNSVGLTWHPESKELWATDNGRDWLGDNLPPDEVNIVQEGKDYGWPFCYGDKVPDPDFNDPKTCERTVAPVVEIQAHSAPLGLTFYNGSMFPDDYKGDLFIAYHGSWNRSIPTGYKVVRVKIKDGKPVSTEDFATGWMTATEKFGRPVDVLVGKNGELFVTDDLGGVIYKITAK